MDYESFKDVPGRTTPDESLIDQAFNLAKNLKYNGYQRALASVVYEFFDKRTSGTSKVVPTENQITANEELAAELYKPIILKFEKTQGMLFF